MARRAPASPGHWSRPCQSVDRAFALLERMADGGGAASISDLAADTGLPLPTIHRLVRSLRRERLRPPAAVPALRARAPADPARRLGRPAARRLGAAAAAAAWSTRSARAPTWRCWTATRSSTSPRCRRRTRCGCSPRSAAGCCRTAPASARRCCRPCPTSRCGPSLARTGMPAQTERTITSPDALVAELRRRTAPGLRHRRRRAGAGVRCVAAAVPSQLAGTAALSMSGPSSRVTSDRVAQIAPLVIAATQGLVATLGPPRRPASRIDPAAGPARPRATSCRRR